MSRLRWIWLVLFLVVIIRTAWIGDDALISLRTVLNATHGYGLTFNAGERVQTFTHPLWLGLLTFTYTIVGNIFYATFALSILTSLVLFAFVLRSARSMTQVLIAAGVLLSSRAFVDYSTSGLENPLTSLVAVATLAWTFREPRGRWWLTGVWLGVSAAYLTRPDAVMLVLPAGIYAIAVTTPRRQALSGVALGLLPAIAWSLFALAYFGFPFPNTAYAKLATDIHLFERIHQGFLYFVDSINRDPITLTAIGAALVAATMERSREAWVTGAGIVLSLTYVFWIGGDFMSGRFLAAPVLLAVWLMSRARQIAEPDWRPALVVMALAAVASPHLPIRSHSGFNAAEPLSGIVDERAVYFERWSLLRADRLAFAEPEWPRWDGNRTPEYVLDTCGLMGADGISWGPKTYMLDECALADPLLARLPAAWNSEWRPGHFRRMVPDGYRESVTRDSNELRDPKLAEYYGTLRTVVRSPSVWSAARLGTIWSMNFGRFSNQIDRQFYKFGGEVVALPALADIVPDGSPWDAAGSHPFARLLAVPCEDQPGRRVLDISLDADDRYRITFTKRNRIVGAVVVDAIPRDRRVPGLISHIVTIPERARRLGFDTIVVTEVAGDARKAVGHLLLDGEQATARELGRRFGASVR